VKGEIGAPVAQISTKPGAGRLRMGRNFPIADHTIGTDLFVPACRS